MFMRIEAAPLIFLTTILALVMLIQQVGAGNAGGGVTAQPAERSAQPDIRFIENLLSDAPAGKASSSTAQVALLRTPISLEQTDLPQR